MPKIGYSPEEVNHETPERELQVVLYDAVMYQLPASLWRYLSEHPDRRDVAEGTLRIAAGENSMPRRVWMRTLAEQIKKGDGPMSATYKPDADCITGPDLETPLRLIRELDAEISAGCFDLADRQYRGQYRAALESLIQAAERRRSALGWIGSRLEAEKIDAADREWDVNAATNPAPSCSGCGNRMTRIRRHGADHDVFTCPFCDSDEVRADAAKEAAHDSP